MSFGRVFLFFLTVLIKTCNCKNVNREQLTLKMIVFESVRENISVLGIFLQQPNRHLLSNLGRIKVPILNLLNFISFTIYAFHGADDFLEYINTIFLASIQFLEFLAVSYCVLNTKKIWNLLDNIEQTINTSKMKVLYKNSARSLSASFL